MRLIEATPDLHGEDAKRLRDSIDHGCPDEEMARRVVAARARLAAGREARRKSLIALGYEDPTEHQIELNRLHAELYK